MKKTILFSALLACLMFQVTGLFADTTPHGHRYYAKHSKHHKMHKLHNAHGHVDATYQN